MVDASVARVCERQQFYSTLLSWWPGVLHVEQGGGVAGDEGMTTEPAPKGAKETQGKTTPSSTHFLQGSEAQRPHLLHPERSEKWCN